MSAALFLTISSCENVMLSGSECESLLENADYALVIGDDAIRAYSGYANILMDVGLEFSKLYGLEPVYAVSATRSNIEISETRIKDLNRP